MKQLVGGISEQGGHAQHEGRRLNLQDFHFVDGAVGIVNHIVDGAREGKDILAVERGDEGLVQLIDQDPAGFVGLLFLGSQHIGCRWVTALPCKPSKRPSPPG